MLRLMSLRELLLLSFVTSISSRQKRFLLGLFLFLEYNIESCRWSRWVVVALVVAVAFVLAAKQ